MTLPGFDKLAPLEYVDASIFDGKDAKEQEVCDFILTLALVQNDLKDLLWAFGEIKERSPKSFELSAEAGQLNGMGAHCVRQLYALHHELLKLVKENPDPQSHELFQNVISRISKDSRAHWRKIVAASSLKPADDVLSKLLVVVRDNIASHYYGTKVLARGFKKYYDGSGPTGKKLFVSRGITPISTRFYFVDGAAQGALEYLARDATREALADRLGDLTAATFVSINAIVTRFMEDRAGAWKPGRWA